MSEAARSNPVNARAAFRQVLPRLVLGCGLAVAGLLFTLDNFGVIYAEDWLDWWPALLVFFGGGLIASGNSAADRMGGGFWALVGGALLLDNLDLFAFSVWDLWPLLLVGLGAMLLLRGLRPRRAAVTAAPGQVTVGEGTPGVPFEEDAAIHAFAMMSGVARKNHSVGFQGGTAVAIMGGVELDLRGATLAGGRAAIDVFALWGGVELTVPPGWAVECRVWPLMGGVEDTSQPPAPEDATGELVLTGTVIMGGLSVKN
jgi:hypothetical protein